MFSTPRTTAPRPRSSTACIRTTKSTRGRPDQLIRFLSQDYHEDEVLQQKVGLFLGAVTCASASSPVFNCSITDFSPDDPGPGYVASCEHVNVPIVSTGDHTCCYTNETGGTTWYDFTDTSDNTVKLLEPAPTAAPTPHSGPSSAPTSEPTMAPTYADGVVDANVVRIETTSVDADVAVELTFVLGSTDVLPNFEIGFFNTVSSDVKCNDTAILVGNPASPDCGDSSTEEECKCDVNSEGDGNIGTCSAMTFVYEATYTACYANTTHWLPFFNVTLNQLAVSKLVTPTSYPTMAPTTAYPTAFPTAYPTAAPTTPTPSPTPSIIFPTTAPPTREPTSKSDEELHVAPVLVSSIVWFGAIAYTTIVLILWGGWMLHDGATGATGATGAEGVTGATEVTGSEGAEEDVQVPLLIRMMRI